ncbi:hypothetical protein [Streptomyces sp. NPDC059906]|uniref:hypothetical protein n=1 Tax=Streptomyces sp. NPDC059906 TaxID=3346997 RepID=UPI00366080E6
MTVQTPHVVLNNGDQMPLLGFGVFPTPDDQTQHAVEDALETCYRLIDTAAADENERAVGRGIAADGIPRAHRPEQPHQQAACRQHCLITHRQLRTLC